MRLLWPLTAACLLALPPVLCVRADEPAPQADPPPVEAAPAEAAPENQEPPEGVRRLPPETETEEREYKKRKTREDPFLTAPPAKDAPVFYNPSNSLRPHVPAGLSRYLVQDQAGKVLGSLTIELRLEQHPTEGELVHLTEVADFSPRYRLDAWVYASTYRPRRTLRRWLDAPDERRSLATTADYLFDRLTLAESLGEVSTRRQHRLPPFTFDAASLPLLLRQLQFVRGDWPFEAALINLEAEIHPLAVAAPQISDCTAADGVSYGCYALTIIHGAARLRAWVERAGPHRVVKFERDGLTCTLQDYQAY